MWRWYVSSLNITMNCFYINNCYTERIILLHRKRNHQKNEKVTYWIFAIQKYLQNHISDKGLYAKYIKNPYWSIAKKSKQINKQKPAKINKESEWPEGLNRHLFKESTQKNNRDMKRCSTSLIIREMQTKTTMRCHLTPVPVTVIKHTGNKSWWGCGEKRTLVHWWWECKWVQPLWKTAWRFLKKLSSEDL